MQRVNSFILIDEKNIKAVFLYCIIALYRPYKEDCLKWNLIFAKIGSEKNPNFGVGFASLKKAFKAPFCQFNQREIVYFVCPKDQYK